jgi:dTDP-4-dehydrorhamnose 3,5-epimerase-like enzyme
MPVEIFHNCALFPLQVLGDARGSLVAIEGGRDVPFDIARVYYIFGTQTGVERGFHAHRELNQYAVCVRGSCTVIVDNGTERRPVPMSEPDRALHLGPMIWHEMRDFSADCVLMVLADAPYDEEDYIRDYDQFVAAARRA